LRVDYQATVSINRILNDCQALPAVPPHQLPGETVQYLMPSRYCPSDQFQSFVRAEFDALEGGRKVIAMRDWVHSHLSYVPGVSTSDTTAADTFIRRQGICRDYAHVLITLVRAAGIPARIASVYALGVEPQDFHAVAEVFLGGEWHLVDATGMAREAAMAKIGSAATRPTFLPYRLWQRCAQQPVCPSPSRALTVRGAILPRYRLCTVPSCIV
jgi:transglutaminase-like putative cysteine protease